VVLLVGGEGAAVMMVAWVGPVALVGDGGGGSAREK
jgi:hypothetical protein